RRASVAEPWTPGRTIFASRPNKVLRRRKISMPIVITTYRLQKPMTLEEAELNFHSTAPGYLGVAGLFRKHYYLSEDRKTFGGIYFWDSRAEADAMFDQTWRATMRARYRSDPSVEYFYSPLVVDNVLQQILSDG